MIPFAQSKVTVSHILSDTELLWQTISLIIIGSILAFLMEFSEFLLLTYTSSLTLSIAGIVKEVFTLYLAVNYNGDQMSLLNFIGLTVCMIGIALHITIRALDTTGRQSLFYSIYSITHLIIKTKAKHIERDSKFEEIESKRLLDGIDDHILFDLKPIGAKIS